MVANVNFDKNIVGTPVLDSAGDTITYSFEIEHQGGEDITDMAFTDTLLGVNTSLFTAISAGDVVLTGDDGDNVFEAGETWTFTEAAGSDIFTYTLTQADLDSNGTAEPDSGFINLPGAIDNLATLTTSNANGLQSFSVETEAALLTIGPDIDIEKFTNGEDADSPTGPFIAVGDPVNWTYVVTNSGNVTLTDVTVVDDNGTPLDLTDDLNFNVDATDELSRGPDTVGDNDDDLEVGEVWNFSATGVATAGQYENFADVSGFYEGSPDIEIDDQTVTDEDPSHYFGIDPQIAILKETNGTDDVCPDVLVGSTVTWTYTVTNPGNVELSNVLVSDDNGTAGDTSDDFAPTFVGGDTDADGKLDTGETWTYTANAAALAGEYINVATANGAFVDGLVNIAAPEASEDDCYTGLEPEITIVKTTNGTDDECPLIIVGEDVTWDYAVTNTGDVPIENVVVTDDNGTPGDTSDDFNPTFVGGDDGDAILEDGETWLYTASGIAALGEYENIASANGTAFDESQNTAPVTDSEEDCYEGVTPGINIVKTTNGTDDVCPEVEVGSTVTWGYTVTNTDTLPISDVVVVDDNGTPGDTSDDFSPTFTGGDTDGDSMLDVGETWTYSANGVAQLGEYMNLATVTGDATDEVGNTVEVTDSEDDCYTGVGEAPGVRTLGFWGNWTELWDGDDTNDPKQTGTPGFPAEDLLYPVDSNNDGTAGGVGDVAGLLIGDYDGDGTNNGGAEDVLFISLATAQALVGTGGGSDGVQKVGRDVVATWLNYLAGNGINNPGPGDDLVNPQHFIDDAIDWLQVFGDSNPSNLNTNDTFDTYSTSHTPVNSSSAFWNQDGFLDHSASEIHSALDQYNNTGFIGLIGYAPDAG